LNASIGKYFFQQLFDLELEMGQVNLSFRISDPNDIIDELFYGLCLSQAILVMGSTIFWRFVS
jgi:hypothetical protein